MGDRLRDFPLPEEPVQSMHQKWVILANQIILGYLVLDRSRLTRSSLCEEYAAAYHRCDGILLRFRW